jgi:hypothetical protein
MFVFGATAPQWAMSSSCLRFLDHTQRRATFGRTPLDDWTSRLRDLYLTTHNTHNRQTSILSAGFEPTILAGERPQTYALDRAATGTGYFEECLLQIFSGLLSFLLLCQYIERNIRNLFYVGFIPCSFMSSESIHWECSRRMCNWGCLDERKGG